MQRSPDFQKVKIFQLSVFSLRIGLLVLKSDFILLASKVSPQLWLLDVSSVLRVSSLSRERILPSQKASIAHRVSFICFD